MAYQDVRFRRSAELLELGLISKDDGYDLSQKKEELKGYILSSTQELFERINASSIVDDLQKKRAGLKQIMDASSLDIYLRKRVEEEVMKAMKSVAYEGVKSGFLIVFRRMGLPENYISSFIKVLEEKNKKLESQKTSFRAD